MSLTKQSVVDNITVVENGIVLVRTAHRIIEDGQIISQTFERHTVNPGDDYSGEDPRVQAICAAAHTADVIDGYRAGIEGAAAGI